MEFKSAPLGAVDPLKHTQQPIVTGASVLGVKYNGGALMIADTLASYGGLARYRDVRRVVKINDTTMLGAGGEYSDFQYILDLLNELTIADYEADDGNVLKPSEVYSYLSRVMYNRRSRVNPLWNELVVAGFHKDKPFLGSVDLYGSTFEDNCVATGYGSYIALPLIRRAWREDLTEAEARKLLEDSMTVLYYRHCVAMNRYTLAKVDASGVEISAPYELETRWGYKLFQQPSGQM